MGTLLSALITTRYSLGFIAVIFLPYQCGSAECLHITSLTNCWCRICWFHHSPKFRASNCEFISEEQVKLWLDLNYCKNLLYFVLGINQKSKPRNTFYFHILLEHLYHCFLLFCFISPFPERNSFLFCSEVLMPYKSHLSHTIDCQFFYYCTVFYIPDSPIPTYIRWDRDKRVNPSYRETFSLSAKGHKYVGGVII